MASAIERILAALGSADLVDALATRLPGTDLTSLLLEVMRRRAERVAPAQVLARYASDRFTLLPAASFGALRSVEDAALRCLPPGCEMLQLAPLVPFGTHRALGATDQNRVMSTIRGQEVASSAKHWPSTSSFMPAA